MSTEKENKDAFEMGMPLYIMTLSGDTPTPSSQANPLKWECSAYYRVRNVTKRAYKKLLFALTLSFSMMGFGYDGTWTENGVTYGYSVTNEVACVSITSCGDSASVVIPAEINGYKVTSFGATGSGCKMKLISVILPDGVTSILRVTSSLARTR